MCLNVMLNDFPKGLSIWASSRMHTHDRISLAECLRAARMRLHCPSLPFWGSGLMGWPGTTNSCRRWPEENEWGRKGSNMWRVKATCYQFVSLLRMLLQCTWLTHSIIFIWLRKVSRLKKPLPLFKDQWVLTRFFGANCKLLKVWWEICVFDQAFETDPVRRGALKTCFGELKGYILSYKKISSCEILKYIWIWARVHTLKGCILQLPSLKQKIKVICPIL